MSFGQLAPAPSHRSATSQGPAAGRQVVPMEKTLGQPALTASQRSSTSQGPTAARHTTPARNPSGGHEMLDPSHASDASQAPVGGRQVAPAGIRRSAGQTKLNPSHASGASHAPTDPRHATPAAAAALDGQSGLTPVHVSAASQSLVASRHTDVGATNEGGHAVLEGEQTSGRSHTPIAARQVVALATADDSGAQVPEAIPVSAVAQAWQSSPTLPPHATLQHTPSVQNPVTHSAPLLHEDPLVAPAARDSTRALPKNAPSP